MEHDISTSSGKKIEGYIRGLIVSGMSIPEIRDHLETRAIYNLIISDVDDDGWIHIEMFSNGRKVEKLGDYSINYALSILNID